MTKANCVIISVCVCVDTIFFNFFNSFKLSATKISSQSNFKPTLLQRRMTVSVGWYSALADCTSQKEPADFGDLSRNMPYCLCRLGSWEWALARRWFNVRAGSPCNGPPPIPCAVWIVMTQLWVINIKCLKLYFCHHSQVQHNPQDSESLCRWSIGP